VVAPQFLSSDTQRSRASPGRAAGLGGLDYPAPSVIYAADPDATTRDEPSQRPYETVIPLAARLGLTVDKKFALGQETQLVTTVVGQTGVVLVAWEHKAIARAIHTFTGPLSLPHPDILGERLALFPRQSILGCAPGVAQRARFHSIRDV
jgi:hypothetical protein